MPAATLASALLLTPGGLGVAEGGITGLSQVLLDLPKSRARRRDAGDPLRHAVVRRHRRPGGAVPRQPHAGEAGRLHRGGPGALAVTDRGPFDGLRTSLRAAVSTMLERVFGDDLARRAAAASIATNSVLMVLKLSVGVISGSVAVLSDGIDSLEDVIAAGITYASLRYGARPPDATHPYGHGRAETLAATFQGLLIGAGGVFILFRAVDRVLNPPESIDTGIAIAVMLVAAAANFALVQYVSRVAKQTGSPAIASEARHLWTNVVQAAAVTLGLVAVGGDWASRVRRRDRFRPRSLPAVDRRPHPLELRRRRLDASLEPEEVTAIEAVIRDSAGATNAFHGLRTRRSGQVRHIDFHLTLPGTMTVDEPTPSPTASNHSPEALLSGLGGDSSTWSRTRSARNRWAIIRNTNGISRTR